MFGQQLVVDRQTDDHPGVSLCEPLVGLAIQAGAVPLPEGRLHVLEVGGEHMPRERLELGAEPLPVARDEHVVNC